MSRRQVDVAEGPTTEVSTTVVDLTSFRLGDLRSGRPQASVDAAVEWALAYAGGPEAIAVQIQNQ
ncbi:hypothetical protein KIPE111705_11275 [Kibdelosporangium persicum]|uniref:hypothetical protein n=1 Tax=Kibdelosporangium persicum TaxID=2698649 RepID=UPI001566214F|nr:hypothetical protein [Kibdelosporangium persicum]